MPDIKLFEMPLAGYLGFPAFAVECFVMYMFTPARLVAWLVAPDRTIISGLMGTATTLEREIKLRFDTAEAAREAVLAAGADAAARPPAAGRRAARQRRERAARAPLGAARPHRIGKSLITFKGPVQDSVMKLREELETVVGDGVLLLRILEELGFRSGSATRSTARSSRTTT